MNLAGEDEIMEENGCVVKKIPEILLNSHLPPFFFLCFIVLMVLFSMDIITTDLVLRQGGYEKNIFMAAIVHLPILHLLVKWAVLLLVLILARIAEKAIRGTGIFALAVVICWYGMVITNNIHVLLSA